MLHSTRRLLTEPLHPLEREAALRIVSSRGGAEDAEALFPLLLADPATRGDLIDPVARHGSPARVERLFDRFVRDGRLADGADVRLLWAFGWAGLEQARPMLFRHACEPNWDVAPAAIDGLVHLSPEGLESDVRAAVETCVGRNLFAEYLPALAGWIGDADLVDRFLTDDHTAPSTDCMSGVVLAVGLLGERGRERLRDLFWRSQYPMIWSDAPQATHVAVRMTGLGVAALADELRGRAAAMDETSFWWFGMVRSVAEDQIALHDVPPAWRFLPAPESPLELHRALFGPDDGWDESLAQLAMQRLGTEGDWLSSELDALRRPIEDLILRDALRAELDGQA
jgi:hypothetical protein